MPPDIRRFLDDIGQRVPGLAEVWLVGSRANGSAKPASDWDFIAMGTPETLTFLDVATDLHRADVDFLVVMNGHDFQAAWGPNKTGSLATWEWKQLDEKNAMYTQSKWVDAVDGAGVRLTRVRAMRVWP